MRYFRRKPPTARAITGVSVLIRYLGYPGWQELPVEVDLYSEEEREEDPLIPVLIQRFAAEKPDGRGCFATRTNYVRTSSN